VASRLAELASLVKNADMAAEEKAEALAQELIGSPHREAAKRLAWLIGEIEFDEAAQEIQMLRDALEGAS